MRVEIVAVGTELLLGQIVDTNSTWIAEQLSAAGIEAHFQTRVGDNIDRIASVFEIALARSDAVIVCGGLGPTQDDVTREAIAKVMGVELECDDEALRLVCEIFDRRGITMAPSNAKQADVPRGGRIIPQRLGTAPGLICPMGERVIYALPGVPSEMREMIERTVLPDLIARSGEESHIISRSIRTWGISESALGEMLNPRLVALDAMGPGAPTIAFLVSGAEGTKVRLTVKAPSLELANKALDTEEEEIRAILGDAIFGVDDVTMEKAVGELLLEKKWTLAVAESFTGGLIAARIVATPGASGWFDGGIVSYASAVKYNLLEVPEGPVVSEQAAAAMAAGVAKLLGADVGLATTGVAGPDPQDGIAPGSAFFGIALPGKSPSAQSAGLVGDRNRAREFGTITALNALRRALTAVGSA